MKRSVLIRWPQGKLKALTLSYDDGRDHDRKMIEILDKAGIICTFNLNNAQIGNPKKVQPEEYNELYKNHEIAVHGKNHVFMKSVPSPILVDEVIANRLELEKITGRIITGMAYPYGPFNETVIEVLKSCGIKYSRTTPRTGKFDLPENWYAWEGTAHNGDEKLFDLCDEFLSLEEPKESWKRANGKLFYLWGHSYEFGDNDNWELLEKFCEKMGGHDDIWYATNMEIYNYVEAYRALEFSAELTRVHNPTAFDVWFKVDNTPVFVKAGETVEINYED